jgi:hypothetical protein
MKILDPGHDEIDNTAARYVTENGCYCGGAGKYTDYNCGASFLVTCPHCRGTGKKQCRCTKGTLTCSGV